MSLQDSAANFVRSILENKDQFGIEMTVTDPSGVQAQITGIPTDIHQSIDPQTGLLVASRTLCVSMPLAAFDEKFGKRPEGVSARGRRQWLVELKLPTMPAAVKYAVEGTRPDAIGIVLCFLQIYEE